MEERSEAESTPTWQLPEYEVSEFNQAQRQRPRTPYAVLIPVLNEGQRIETQLIRMRPFLGLVDTFIVDGGSTDGSTEAGKLFQTGLRGLLVKKGVGRLSAQLRVG